MLFLRCGCRNGLVRFLILSVVVRMGVRLPTLRVRILSLLNILLLGLRIGLITLLCNVSLLFVLRLLS